MRTRRRRRRGWFRLGEGDARILLLAVVADDNVPVADRVRQGGGKAFQRVGFGDAVDDDADHF